MKHWKQVSWLASFELKVSAGNIIVSYLILVPISLFFILSVPSYLEKPYVGFDLFFIFLFLFAPSLIRSKKFQYQRIDGDIWGSPTYMMQSKLPIPLDLLVKSRFTIYFVFSFPLLSLFLVVFYLFTPAIQSLLSPFSYIAFASIWLAFSIYAGSIMPASDAGYKANNKEMIFTMIGIYAGFTILLTFFLLITRNGIVNWTIFVAQNFPFFSILVSIILAILGFNFWENMMKRQTKRLDYFSG